MTRANNSPDVQAKHRHAIFQADIVLFQRILRLGSPIAICYRTPRRKQMILPD